MKHFKLGRVDGDSPSKTVPMVMAALAIAINVAGCNNKNEKDLLGKAKSAAIRRVDQFQAAATNQKVAVVVGGGTIVVSNLQGENARRINLPGTPALIDLASCADGTFVALDFYRRVWLADEAGSTWKAVSIEGKWRPLALTCDLQNHIWVVGSDTTIATSTDRGASWQQRDFQEDAMFTTVQFVDAQNGFVTGEFGNFYKTTDGGATWSSSQKIPNDFYPYAALFTGPSEGYVSGLAGAILYTADAGNSWEKLENVAGLPQFGIANLGGTIFAVGAAGSLQQLEGKQWKAVSYANQKPAQLRAITPIASDRLLIAGFNGSFHMVQRKTLTAPATQTTPNGSAS